MSAADLIELHASAEYRVYMIGFAPGFAYLGGLPAKLHTPRLAVPRQRIEAGAVGIGGSRPISPPFRGLVAGDTLDARLLVFSILDARTRFFSGLGTSIRFRRIGDAEARDLDERIAAGALGIEELRS